jgi:predicted DNA-binding transcriptional regulator AlpA
MHHNNDRRRWLTVREFADELGVSISTAYKWSAAGAGSGRFPRHTKLPNGSIRIRRDWLDDWMTHHDSLR